MEYQILDASIVVVLSQALPLVNHPGQVFETGSLVEYIKGPFTYTQGLAVDPAHGPVASWQIESMRSQKIVSLGGLRIETHDRSGRLQLEEYDLPHMVSTLLEALGVRQDHVQAIGCNFEAELLGSAPAGSMIANASLQSLRSTLPPGISMVGGALRLYLEEEGNASYTISFEPRFNNPMTNNIWVAVNCNVSGSLSRDQLSPRFVRTFGVWRDIATALFDRPKEPSDG